MYKYQYNWVYLMANLLAKCMITSCSSNWVILLLPYTTATLVLCGDQFVVQDSKA